MDLAELFDSCSANCHPGSDCRAVALGADKSEQYAMKTIRGHILEKRGWLADVQQKNVHVASVKNVAESGTATGFHGQFRETGLLRDFVESSVTIITMHEQRLAKARTGFQSVNLRINVAVGHQNVEPAIVVVIHPHDAEAIVSDVVVDASFDGNFFKSSVTTIVVKEIAFAFEAPRSALHQNALEAAEFVTSELRKVVHVQMGIAGDEKIHETVAVVVASRRAGHKATADDTGLFSDVLELPVAARVLK